MGVCGVGYLMYECVRQKRTFVEKERQWRGTFFTVVTFKHRIHFSKLLIHFCRDFDIVNDLYTVGIVFIRCSNTGLVLLILEMFHKICNQLILLTSISYLLNKNLSKT